MPIRLVGLSVGLSVRKVYCGKTADWIRIPFGVVSGVNRAICVLDGWLSSKGRGSFGGEVEVPHCNHWGLCDAALLKLLWDLYSMLDCCSDMVPMSCLPMILHLADGDAVKLDSIMWSTYGAVITLSCAHGTFFVEGGTSRTLVCINGVWPTVRPRCTGL